MLIRLGMVALLMLPGMLWAETIRLGGMPRCPYICDINDPQSGFMLDIAREIFEGQGYQVQFDPLPWSRALRSVRSGGLDGIAGVLRRNAPDLIYPRQAQALSDYAFFVPQDSNWQHTGLVSLWQVRIGITQDISYGSMDSYIHRYLDDARIQSLAGEAAIDQNLLALKRQRIDVVLEDRAVMGYHLRSDALTISLKEAGSLHSEHLYIAFSPGSPRASEYSQILSDGLDLLRADGRLDQILARYGLSDWH